MARIDTLPAAGHALAVPQRESENIPQNLGAPPAPERAAASTSGRRPSPLVRGLLAAAGLGALVWFASGVDWRETGRLLSRLGWWTVVIPVPYAVVYVADTLGWLACFPFWPRASFARLYRIRWAGEAVNSLIPSGYVGGEAVKVFLLARVGVASSVSAVAAVISKTQQSVAQLAFLGLGALAFLRMGTAPPGFSRAMALVFGLGVLLLGVWIALQRRGVFAAVHGLLRRVTGIPARWVEAVGRLRTLDASIQGFRRAHPRRHAGSFAGYLAGWLLDTVELCLVGALLGFPVTWEQALGVEAFVGVAKALGVFIPGALGVQESSIVFLCRMAGIPESVGAAYAIIRRVRELAFAVVGWKFLLWEQVRMREVARGDAAAGESTA